MISHNLVTLAQLLQAPRRIVEAARELNADYVTTRYPDAANGIPADQFSLAIAKRHLKAARSVVQWVKGLLT